VQKKKVKDGAKQTCFGQTELGQREGGCVWEARAFGLASYGPEPFLVTLYRVVKLLSVTV
jgi:hypothetical protein